VKDVCELIEALEGDVEKLKAKNKRLKAKNKRPSKVAAPCDCSVCLWVEDSEGCYGTSCGHAWMFTHELGLEGEQGDGFQFCPFCGKPIDGTQNAVEFQEGSEAE